MREKIFSGESSNKFWNAVNRCSFEKGKDKDILYDYGCEAQEIEQQRDDLLEACKEALPLIAGERITYDALPPTDHLLSSLAKDMSKCEKMIEAAIAKCGP